MHPRLLVIVLLVLLAPACTEEGAEPTGPESGGAAAPCTLLTYRLREGEASQEQADAVRHRLKPISDIVRVNLTATGEIEVRIETPAGGEILRRVKKLLARRGTFELLVTAPPEIEARERKRREDSGADYPGPPAGLRWVPSRHEGRPDRLVEIGDEVDRFTGADMEPGALRIRPDQPPGLGWVVYFTLREDRKEAFRRFSKRILKRELAIIVDGAVESAPTVQTELPGSAQISGGGIEGFTKEEAEDLVAILRSVPLPVELMLLSERTLPD